MYFSICFASSKFSKRASKLHEKEHFARDLKVGGHEPTVPPGSYVHGPGALREVTEILGSTVTFYFIVQICKQLIIEAKIDDYIQKINRLT